MGAVACTHRYKGGPSDAAVYEPSFLNTAIKHERQTYEGAGKPKRATILSIARTGDQIGWEPPRKPKKSDDKEEEEEGPPDMSMEMELLDLSEVSDRHTTVIVAAPRPHEPLPDKKPAKAPPPPPLLLSVHSSLYAFMRPSSHWATDADKSKPPYDVPELGALAQRPAHNRVLYDTDFKISRLSYSEEESAARRALSTQEPVHDRCANLYLLETPAAALTRDRFVRMYGLLREYMQTLILDGHGASTMLLPPLGYTGVSGRKATVYSREVVQEMISLAYFVAHPSFSFEDRELVTTVRFVAPTAKAFDDLEQALLAEDDMLQHIQLMKQVSTDFYDVDLQPTVEDLRRWLQSHAQQRSYELFRYHVQQLIDAYEQHKDVHILDKLGHLTVTICSIGGKIGESFVDQWKQLPNLAAVPDFLTRVRFLRYLDAKRIRNLRQLEAGELRQWLYGQTDSLYLHEEDEEEEDKPAGPQQDTFITQALFEDLLTLHRSALKAGDPHYLITLTALDALFSLRAVLRILRANDDLHNPPNPV